MKPLYDITPFTTVDFPDHLAAIAWFSGCNLRCQYCYNPDIVLCSGRLTVEDFQNFLITRQGLLDGVVLSGGEPLRYASIQAMAQWIKSQNFALKIDTNGTYPQVLKRMLDEDLVDTVALDFKALRHQWENVTGRWEGYYDHFEQTLRVLIKAKIRYEVRMTLHPSLISPDDLDHMVQYLRDQGYCSPIYVQRYRHYPTLGEMEDVPIDQWEQYRHCDVVWR